MHLSRKDVLFIITLIVCFNAFLVATVGLLFAGHSAQTPAIPGSGDVNASAYEWDLPAGFPMPYVPPDNPMSAAKVELGRHLFYDVRLSGNQTLSCASCHRQELAFTDGLARAVGSTGMIHPRNSMALVNVAYNGSLTWGNHLLLELERQIPIPIFGDNPVELRVGHKSKRLQKRFDRA
jgi:cytochrome c peroxidase